MLIPQIVDKVKEALHGDEHKDVRPLLLSLELTIRTNPPHLTLANHSLKAAQELSEQIQTPTVPWAQQLPPEGLEGMVLLRITQADHLEYKIT